MAPIYKKALISSLAAVGASIVLIGCSQKPGPGPEAKGDETAKPIEIPASLARFVGTWEKVDPVANANPAGGLLSTRLPEPQLTPAYKARYEAMKKAFAEGKFSNDQHANCLPFGMPRMMQMPLPFEVLATPKKLVLIPEDQSPARTIWLDGRAHPQDVDPSYTGHSVGHWEGEVLVVDTVGLRGDVPLNAEGLTPTKDLHVVERISFEKDGTLRDEVATSDPTVFTAPWIIVRRYKHIDYDLQEMVCEENNRNSLAKDGSSQLLDKPLR